MFLGSKLAESNRIISKEYICNCHVFWQCRNTRCSMLGAFNPSRQGKAMQLRFYWRPAWILCVTPPRAAHANATCSYDDTQTSCTPQANVYINHEKPTGLRFNSPEWVHTGCVLLSCLCRTPQAIFTPNSFRCAQDHLRRVATEARAEATFSCVARKPPDVVSTVILHNL